MPSKARHYYEFGPFRLDADKHRLMRDGEFVHLSPKAIEALLVLVRNPGQLLEREALMQAVWAGSFVEDANLTVAISHLRKAFGQDNANAEYIETVPRAGYRFVAEVREIWEEPAALVIEKRTVSRTVIEEEELHQAPSKVITNVLPLAKSSRFKRAPFFAAAGLALAAFAGVTVWRTVPETSTASRPLPIKSIAILPFRVVGGTSQDQYQSLGLADILITRMSNLKHLKVRPTSAVSAFENSTQDSLEFGKKLQVDAVLEGTIYRAGDKVRVTARLVNVADGTSRWSGEFEKLANDELSIQHEIASQVTGALALNLAAAEGAALNKQFTANEDAYQLYVKGRYEWNKRTWAGSIEAERLFRNAIEKDRNFALAYAGLGDVLALNVANSSQAHFVVRKALELDPTMAEAHATLGFLQMFHTWDWQAAEASFKKSIELNPGYATAHHWYAQLLTIFGKHEEAKLEMLRALEINPLSHNFLADLGQIHYFNREYKRAEEHCRKALEIYPDFEFAHNYLFFVYLKTGEYDRAVESKLTADRIHSTFVEQSSKDKESIITSQDEERHIYRKGGIQKFVGRHLEKTTDANVSYVLAIKYAFLDEKENALECLEKAYQGRGFLLAFVKADPIFDNLRREPRYQAILRNMRLE